MKAKLIMAILLFAIIGLNSDGVMAAGPIDIDAEVGLFNKYVWRGIPLTDGPVLQPSLSFGLKNLSINIWGNLDLDDANTKEFEMTETDYTVEYSKSFTMMSAAIGVIHYTFPVANGADATTEIYIGASCSGPGNPSLTIYQDVKEGEGTYVTLSASQSIPIGLIYSIEVSGTLGWGSAKHNNFNYGQDGSALSDINIGIGVPFGIGDIVSVTPGVSYTGILNGDISDTMDAANIDDQNVLFGIAVAAGF